MKRVQKINLCALFCYSVCLAVNAQTPGRLSILKDSPSSVQISWTNQAGTNYRVLFAPTLASPTVWKPLEDAFSSDANVLVSVTSTNPADDFFRVQIPTNGTSPAVQIFSPTNAQTVSDIIAIRAGAQIGGQLQGINLYLDNAQVGFVDSGGIEFDVDTTHFANGNHSLYVSAADTGNTQTSSSSITLNFSNPVRWLDADSLFQSFVPIDVQSDIFPATWAVFVEDTNGVTVRTFSGSTSDGNINTNWDGNDNNGIYAPDQSAYNITVVVTSTNSGNSALMASSAINSSSQVQIYAMQNRYGVTEYETVEQAPDPVVVYQELLKSYLALPKDLRFLFPPIPRPTGSKAALVKTPVSAREMFLRQHQGSNGGGVTPFDGTSGGGTGSTHAAVWREKPWSSGQTILARVTIPGAYNTVVQNYFLQIRDLIDAATAGVGNNRGVFGPDSIYVMANASDFGALTNNFISTSSDARAFYFYGHGNANGNVISGGTGFLRAKDLGVLLGNYYAPFKPGKPLSILTHKPFSFVFLDGCNTGLGSFPEAFGIPKISSDVSFNDYHKHKRAFMGWGAEVTFVFGSDNFDWTQKFWATWLNDPNYDKQLHEAVEAANQYRPNVTNSTPMMIYGSRSLTWAD